MFEALVDGLTVLPAILLMLGFILISIELTAPGLSVPGISGIVCLVVGIVLTADNVTEGLFLLGIVFVLLLIMFGVFFWLFSKGKVVSPFILKSQQSNEEGFVSKTNVSHLVGKHGVAATDLRPTGIGVFEGKRYNVVSNEGYIEKEATIVVEQVKDLSIIVRKEGKE